jgi:uncharacterized protein YkwD
MGGKYGKIERYVHRKVNSRREDRGRSRLKGHPDLIEAAQSHARDMATHEFTGHVGSEGSSPSDRVSAEFVGENVARVVDDGRHPSTIAENAVASWMQSAGHRENIMNREFSRSGVGVWKRDEDVYLVQTFAASVPSSRSSDATGVLARLF